MGIEQSRIVQLINQELEDKAAAPLALNRLEPSKRAGGIYDEEERSLAPSTDKVDMGMVCQRRTYHQIARLTEKGRVGLWYANLCYLPIVISSHYWRDAGGHVRVMCAAEGFEVYTYERALALEASTPIELRDAEAELVAREFNVDLWNLLQGGML